MLGGLPPKRFFVLKNGGLIIQKFKNTVHDVWNAPTSGAFAIEIWQPKTRLLRKKVKGWSINLEAELKKKKRNLMQEFDILDVFYEDHRLDDSNRTRMNDIKELEIIWHKEEVTLWQRSRDRRIKDGDKNNAYFHTLANHRHRKNHLSELNSDNGTVYSTKEMLEVVTSFYENLFGHEDKFNVIWDLPSGMMWSWSLRMTMTFFSATFLRKKLRKPFLVHNAHGAPCLDGLSFLFSQTFWDLIKYDFIAGKQSGSLPLASLPRRRQGRISRAAT